MVSTPFIELGLTFYVCIQVSFTEANDVQEIQSYHQE